MSTHRIVPRRPTFVVALLAMLAGPTAQAAQAQASAQIQINAPAERIWRLLTAVDGWPAWNPAVASARIDGPLRPGTVFVWKSQGFTVTSTLQQVEPFTGLSWTGSAIGTKAFHAWTLETTADGVLVKTFETFDGWLPWLLQSAMQKQLDETLPAWLQALKAATELDVNQTGEASGRH
jgi:uncharacterized protein YndB with AHSA1/START domain